MIEPSIKKVVAFVDGQNLFFTVREAFGYTYPNYDVKALASAVCAAKPDWQLSEVRFYTGVPSALDDQWWNDFWSRKLLAMNRQGISVYSRSLRYRNKVVRLPNGVEHSYLSGEEKGIDVRMAIDILSLAYRRAYDVALVFSQDQDLSEVAEELRVVARDHGRWLRIASAFPRSPTTKNTRGINKTDWIPVDRSMYDACIDPRDYRKHSS